LQAHLRAVAIVPARYASSRFPGKPLARETGKYLIQHVFERARAARRIERAIVATDDERIASACRSFGAEVAMTPASCPSGLDRCAHVAAKIDCDLVVDVQGDEPEIEPESIDALVDLMEKTGAPVATLAFRSRDEAAWRSPAVVKVVRDAQGRALYFSRAPIPHARDRAGGAPEEFLWHVGTYAFRRQALLEFARMPPSPLERAEALEQLRALEAGWHIAVGEAAGRWGGIDTPEQYREFVERQKKRERGGG
jgi:3-deoxy-manno-octulosonate cytidylyltransferase (CMP-KDO synthetase)